MQRHNIYKGTIISVPSVIDGIQTDFELVLADSGVAITYTHFDEDVNHFTDDTTMYCYLDPFESKDESGGLVSDLKFTALFSSKSFYTSAGVLIYEPSKKDKITYNNEVYSIAEIYYYDVANALTTKLKNSLIVSMEITKRTSFTRNDLF